MAVSFRRQPAFLPNVARAAKKKTVPVQANYRFANNYPFLLVSFSADRAIEGEALRD
jgi:hypothetical protein